MKGRAGEGRGRGGKRSITEEPERHTEALAAAALCVGGPRKGRRRSKSRSVSLSVGSSVPEFLRQWSTARQVLGHTLRTARPLVGELCMSSLAGRSEITLRLKSIAPYRGD